MADEYKISVALSRAEIAIYNFHHIRWLLTLDIFGLALLFVGSYFSIAHPNPSVRQTLTALTIWGALILAVGFSQPLILLLQVFVFKTPEVENQMAWKNYIFSDEGIHIQSGGRQATTPWSRIIAIKDIGRIFLIYTTPKLAYVIPKRYFSSPEERDRFVSMLMIRAAINSRN